MRSRLCGMATQGPRIGTLPHNRTSCYRQASYQEMWQLVGYDLRGYLFTAAPKNHSGAPIKIVSRKAGEREVYDV